MMKSQQNFDNESVYSMRTDTTHVSQVTVTTDQLGLTVSLVIITRTLIG